MEETNKDIPFFWGKRVYPLVWQGGPKKEKGSEQLGVFSLSKCLALKRCGQNFPQFITPTHFLMQVNFYVNTTIFLFVSLDGRGGIAKRLANKHVIYIKGCGIPTSSAHIFIARVPVSRCGCVFPSRQPAVTSMGPLGQRPSPQTHPHKHTHIHTPFTIWVCYLNSYSGLQISVTYVYTNRVLPNKPLHFYDGLVRRRADTT